MKPLCLRSVLVLVFLPASGVLAQLTGYERLAEWSQISLARPGLTAGLASSYDRAGTDATPDTNNDYNNFIRSQNGWYVAAEESGPGAITRFWMPHLSANTGHALRVFLDGNLVINGNSNDFLQGSYGAGPLFRSPLVQTLVGGQVSYEPIPFQHSLRIESNILGANFYQFNIERYAPNTIVPTYSGALNAAQQSQRGQVVAMLNNVGENPAGADGSATTISESAQSIPAGGALTLADLSGSGQIRSLKIRLRDESHSPSNAQLDGLRLRVRYDQHTQHAIDVPVSHFFGVGHSRADYQSLPLGVADDESYYSYWPMPYRQGAVVELYNSTGGAIPLLSSEIETVSGEVPDQAGYLHAVHREETTTEGQVFYNLLEAEGRGQYVGNMLYMRSSTRNTLEGDDLIEVDGQLLHGTGLEDAYNGGYYYNNLANWLASDDGDEPFPTSGAGPYHGLLNFSGWVPTITDQYRWMIGDAVPFEDQINVKIENFRRLAGQVYGSTAFYYSAAQYGDSDLDGDVDLSDLARLAAFYDTSVGASWTMGDFDGDGDVDLNDLSRLASHYDGGSAQAMADFQALAVPEPAAFSAILVVAGLYFPYYRRRSHSKGAHG